MHKMQELYWIDIVVAEPSDKAVTSSGLTNFSSNYKMDNVEFKINPENWRRDKKFSLIFKEFFGLTNIFRKK